VQPLLRPQQLRKLRRSHHTGQRKPQRLRTLCNPSRFRRAFHLFDFASAGRFACEQAGTNQPSRASTGLSGGRTSNRQGYRKLPTAVFSSEYTSKTVNNFVSCSRSCTFLVRCKSFKLPPRFFTVVKAVTSSPMPELSM